VGGVETRLEWRVISDDARGRSDLHLRVEEDDTLRQIVSRAE
jgi:hypothetical protein